MTVEIVWVEDLFPPFDFDTSVDAGLYVVGE